MRFQELQLLSLLLLLLSLLFIILLLLLFIILLLFFFFNRIIARAGLALQAIDVKQALPIKDIDAYISYNISMLEECLYNSS